ncbi:hypothetical protein DFS34DRAFT_267574 [Phlyctochytrium arcticum]|nr:hypothetical protein DFS34DRAFT_267574 [Phlyctochytrium arcticum]
MDLLTLIQHTLITRKYVPDIPQLTDFALEMISRIKKGTGLTLVGPEKPKDPLMSNWASFFRTDAAGKLQDAIGTSGMQDLPLKGLRNGPVKTRSLQLYLKAATPSKPSPKEPITVRRPTSTEFLQFLGMHQLDIATSKFGKDERNLLGQVFIQMQSIEWRSKVSPHHCPLLIMLLYNIAVKQYQDSVAINPPPVNRHLVLGFNGFSVIKRRVKKYVKAHASNPFIHTTLRDENASDEGPFSSEEDIAVA